MSLCGTAAGRLSDIASLGITHSLELAPAEAARHVDRLPPLSLDPNTEATATSRKCMWFRRSKSR
jgi:hypothetical protein